MGRLCPSREPSLCSALETKGRDAVRLTPIRTPANFAGTRTYFTALLDFFPEGGVQAPCQHQEATKEQQNPDAEALTRILRGFTHPLQVSDQISDRNVVFDSSHLAWFQLFEADKLVNGLAFFVRIFLFGILWSANTLQFPQHVRHADVRENHVIPAGWAAVVLVICTQIRINPVRTGA